jgi:hypothetical protein
MSRRSGLSGVSKLRRTLRRLDPVLTKEIRREIEITAGAIQADAIAGAPIDEGDLVRSIDYKIGRDGLTAVIGPGAAAAEIARRKTGSAFGTRNAKLKLSKRNTEALYQFFKGYWIEYGTKGVGGVGAQPARPFMGPAYQANERAAVAGLRRAIGQALKKASGGG